MKIEFLPGGAEDCPLIRLFDFAPAEARQLIDILAKLANGSSNRVSLYEMQWIDSIEGCRLILEVGETNRGIIDKGNKVFECILDRSRWDNLAGLAEPFGSCINKDNFQWLDETSSISLLISPSGQW